MLSVLKIIFGVIGTALAIVAFALGIYPGLTKHSTKHLASGIANIFLSCAFFVLAAILNI